MSLRAIPVRWKFTAWYASLLALSLLLFGAAIYFGTRWQLSDDLDEELDDRSIQVKDLIRFSPTGLTLDTTYVAIDDDRLIRVWDSSGSVVADTSGEFESVPDFAGDVGAALSGESRWTEFRGNDETLRALLVPVLIDGDIVGAILVAQSTGEIDEALAGLIRLLLGTLPVALTLAAVTGYVVAGRVLAPVVRITDLASRIDSQGLHQRLSLRLPDDELGRLARTFDSMLNRIEEAFDQQRRFTGDAAHELRTPLGIMRSRIELALARPRTPEEYRLAITELDRDLTRMSDLTSSLLRLARLDATGFQIDAEQFDLKDLLVRVAESYAEVPSELVVKADSVAIWADQDLILQLLINLMDNAVRHTPADGRIVLGCEIDKSGTRIWVEDNGPGIPSAFLGQVFNRFFRIDEGRTRQGGGVGLGLSICHAIVVAHRGTISVENVAPHGLRVNVHLPHR